MGGILWQKKTEVQKPSSPKVESVDIVKMKLKSARDKIKNFVSMKSKDLGIIEAQISEKVPAFKETGNKKQLVPLLKAKKDLQKIIESADVRMKLVNNKLDEVQMQKMNAETINVLEESNQYIKEVQQSLEAKDWRKVLEDAKQKYQIEWPDDSEDVQEDPAFQQMWDEIGGNKLDKKTVEKKTVNVNVPQKQQQKKIVHV